MNKKQMGPSPLAEAEMAVLEAGREWMRQRLERDLQKHADQVGEFSPLEPSEADMPTPQSDPDSDIGGQG